MEEKNSVYYVQRSFIMYKEVGIVCTEVHSQFLLKNAWILLFLMKTLKRSQKKLPLKQKATDF